MNNSNKSLGPKIIPITIHEDIENILSDLKKERKTNPLIYCEIHNNYYPKNASCYFCDILES